MTTSPTTPATTTPATTTTSLTFVKASAGAGKTTDLTRELATLMSEGPEERRLSPEQVIVVTFTEKAASELREKTAERLIARGNLDAASRLPTALIGTVNATASALVQDFAVDLGLSPNLEVLDEAGARTLLAEVLAPIMARLTEEEGARDALVRLGYELEPRSGKGRGTGPYWGDLVRTVIERARANRISTDTLTASVAESLALIEEAVPGRDDGTDVRDRCVAAVQAALDALERDILLAETDPASITILKADGTAMNRKNGPTANDLVKLRKGGPEGLRILHDLLDEISGEQGLATTPWSTWQKVLGAEYLKGQGKGQLAAALAPLGGAAALLQSPALREDLHTVASLVLTCAGQALEEYATAKRRLGVLDFVDQESYALDLLTHEQYADAQAVIHERYRYLAVDEFQDTSPIQLALFLALSRLVDQVRWVGDPKQAIYGFRGADPALMSAIAHALENRSHGVVGKHGLFSSVTTATLNESYRSWGAPLALSNALSVQLFCAGEYGLSDDPLGDVQLSLPAKRRTPERLQGGELAVWQAVLDNGGPGKKETAAWVAAIGVANLLQDQEAEGSPEEDRSIAVLCRKSDEVAQVASSLNDLGVPVSGYEYDLLDTREGQILRAALAYLADDSDTIALAELTHLLRDAEALTPSAWFDELTAAAGRDGGVAEVHRAWREQETVRALDALRLSASELTPAELVTAVVGAVQLDQRLKQYSGVNRRRAHLDAALALADAYAATCRTQGRTTTASGLLDHLATFGAELTSPEVPGSVVVTTIHKSKGRGWGTVVWLMARAKEDKDRQVPSVIVDSRKELTVSAPLEGRSLLVMPAHDTSASALKARLCAVDRISQAMDAELAEEARLAYVALTRAKYRTVLVPLGGPENSVINQVAERFGTRAAIRTTPLEARRREDSATSPAKARAATDGGTDAGTSAPLLGMPGGDGSARIRLADPTAALDPAGRVEGEEADAAATAEPVTLPPRPWISTEGNGPAAVEDADPLLNRIVLPATVVRTTVGVKQGQRTSYQRWPDDLRQDENGRWSLAERDETNDDAPEEPEAATEDGVAEAAAAAGAAAQDLPAGPLVVRAAEHETAEDAHWTDILAADGAPEARAQAPARFRASGSPSQGVTADVELIEEDLERFDAPQAEPLPSLDGVTHALWNKVGDAYHAYLALPHEQLTPTQQERAAQRVLQVNGVADRLRPQHLIRAGARWTAWLRETHPGGVEATEVPISWSTDDGGVLQGSIDSLLVEPTAGGAVDEARIVALIDHKSTVSGDPAEHIRTQYLGQMDLYRRVIEESTGSTPATILIHMPVLGRVYQLSFAEHVSD